MDKKTWNNALQPFAIVLAGIEDSIANMENDDLLELQEACKHPTKTNCWCYVYQAAQLISAEVNAVVARRKLNAEAQPSGEKENE
jgi:hypothetical protein